MSLKNINNFLKSKMGRVAIIVSAVSLVLALGISYSLNDSNNNKQIAQASSVVSLAPGQTGLFTIQYINAGDTDGIASALTNIFLSNRLTYLPNSLTDQYGGTTQPLNCVSDASGIVTVAGDGSTQINYRPRSATTLIAPCNGLSTAGPSTLIAAPEATPSETATWPAAKTGTITFRATLKSDQGLVAGNTVNFAIIAGTTLDGATGGAASLNISVVEPITVPGFTTVSSAYTSNGICSPITVNIGTTYECNFPLTGNTLNNYVLPTGPISAATSQNGSAGTDLTPVTGGYGLNCTIIEPGTINVALNCTNIPTVGGTAGLRNVLLQYGGPGSGTPPVDKGNITLAIPPIVTPPPVAAVRSGRMYCVGLNNAPVLFDAVTRENTNCNITQKLKDGNIRVIYDDLRDSSNNILTTGTCTFEFIRSSRAYIPTNILRSFTSNITNGSCETTLSADDQTVNYYKVIGTATSGTTVLRETYNLNLFVGG